LLILVSVVILVGVVSVAMGHGGEMAEFASDYPPFDVGDLMTAADVALLRPPSALWGYNVQATDEALGRIARVVTERDVEIADLRRRLAESRIDPAPAGTAAADFGPAESVPTDVAPADVAPAEAAPAEAAPAEGESADAGTGSGG
jgi:hypothetical protein